MTRDLITSLRATLTRGHLQRFLSPEVLMPALVPFELVRLVADSECMPVFYDQRAPVYVPEAELFALGSGINGNTAAVVVTRPFGASPNVQAIFNACAVHGVPCVFEEPRDDDHAAQWHTVYGESSRFVDRLTLPEINPEESFAWYAYPLLARCEAERDRLVTALAPWGAERIAASPAETERMADCESWGVVRDLDGARDITNRGFVIPLPLRAEIAWLGDAFASVLGAPAF